MKVSDLIVWGWGGGKKKVTQKSTALFGILLYLNQHD